MNTETAIETQTKTNVTLAGSFKEIAMALVARGIPVIPIPPRQKGTNLKDWQNLATTDLTQIEKWNAENPQYNVGAVAKFNGYWMLDCDVQDLSQKIELKTGQSFPHTFTVRSNKGKHFYFKHTAASRGLKKNIQLKDEQGNVLCDTKLNNGYVVAPGSIHPSGKRYEVVNDAEITEAPNWLVKWIKERHEHAEADQNQHGASEGKVPKGGRDNYLFNMACKFRDAGMPKSDALMALHGINKSVCEPPMENSVVDHEVESAYNYEPAQASTVQELIEKPDQPSHTDLGNAQRLVVTEGKDIRYCYKNKSWYVWNGCMWSKDESGGIDRVAKRTVKAMLSEAVTLDDQQCKILVAHEQKSESEGRLHSMISLARSEPGIPVRLVDFDADPMLFNCLSATIHLSTGKAREHCRGDLISKIAPVEYEPNSECPKWRDFLNDVTDGDWELANYLQTCIGYSLTGKTSEHALFLLYGTGANGKSTFLEVLRYVFGDYSQAADFGSFLFSNGQSVRNDLAKLNGARFVTANESDSGKRLDETVVKQMTGGDTVTARFLYGEHFEFTPHFKLWLGTNHRPTIRGQDKGVWRRIRLIPFTVSILRHRQDQTLKDKLKLEASGILNWALEGLARWRQNGLQEPGAVKDATENYRADQDVLGQFIEARCFLALNVQSNAHELYAAYKVWAQQTNEWVMNERKFSNALTERGRLTKKRYASGVKWEGIELLPLLPFDYEPPPTADY